MKILTIKEFVTLFGMLSVIVGTTWNVADKLSDLKISVARQEVAISSMIQNVKTLNLIENQKLNSKVMFLESKVDECYNKCKKY